MSVEELGLQLIILWALSICQQIWNKELSLFLSHSWFFLLLFFKGFVFNSLILSLEEAKAFLKISGGGGELGPIEGLSQRSLSEVS